MHIVRRSGLAALIVILTVCLAAPVFAAKKDLAKVGDRDIALVGPEGLTRVDGRSKTADDYIKSKEPKMKFRVLAIYADPAEWDGFVKNLEAKRAATLSRYAVIGSATKVETKSYDAKMWAGEKKKYKTWFDLATNTMPITALMNSRFNDRLRKATAPGIEVSFEVDRKTSGRFADIPQATSFGVNLANDFFGGRNKVFLTATAIKVSDKLFFVGYADAREAAEVKEAALRWRDLILAANPD